MQNSLTSSIKKIRRLHSVFQATSGNQLGILEEERKKVEHFCRPHWTPQNRKWEISNNRLQLYCNHITYQHNSANFEVHHMEFIVTINLRMSFKQEFQNRNFLKTKLLLFYNAPFHHRHPTNTLVMVTRPNTKEGNWTQRKSENGALHMQPISPQRYQTKRINITQIRCIAMHWLRMRKSVALPPATSQPNGAY